MPDKPKVVCVLTARMSSERLPGKALVEYGDPPRPNLAWMVERYQSVPGIDYITVATSDFHDDDDIADWCHRNYVAYYRGSKSDVTRRIREAAQPYAPDYVVRGTCDCPFLEPDALQMAIDVVTLHGADAGRIAAPPHHTAIYGSIEYPYSWRAVVKMDDESTGPGREHFGWHLEEHRSEYYVIYPQATDAFYQTYYRPYRLELDTPQDLELVRRIYEALQADGTPIPLHRVIRLLDARPDLRSLNQHILERTGPQTSFDKHVWEAWAADMQDKTVAWNGDWAWLHDKPEGVKAIWCRKGTCYLGWVQHDRAGQSVLHRPDGTKIEGDADIPCSCGAGKRWRERR